MAAVSLDGAFGLSASEMWKRRGGGSRRAKAASRGQEKCDLTRLGTAKCGISARAETPRGGRERRRQKRHSHRGRRGWWGGSGARWPRTAARRVSGQDERPPQRAREQQRRAERSSLAVKCAVHRAVCLIAEPAALLIAWPRIVPEPSFFELVPAQLQQRAVGAASALAVATTEAEPTSQHEESSDGTGNAIAGTVWVV